MRARHALAVALVGGLTATSAQADVADDCFAASSTSSTLQTKGQLVEARSIITKCEDAACPAAIRDVCVERAERLNASIPTIVFDVKDAAGNDLPDVSVVIDGVQSKQAVTVAFSANPGAHKFAFQAAGKLTLEKTFVLRESERGRRETIVIADQPIAVVAKPVPQTVVVAPQKSGSIKSESPSNGTGQRVAGGVIAAVGIVGGVVAGVFGGLWAGKKSDYTTYCPTGASSSCPTDKPTVTIVDGIVSDENTFSIVAGVAGVAGGVLLVTGVVVFLTAPKSRSTSALTISPVVGAGVEGLMLRGTF